MKRGQVVEKLGVSRRLAPQAKVTRGRDQGVTEVVHPNPVHQSAGRERVIVAGDRPRELEPAATVSKRFPIRTSQGGEEPTWRGLSQIIRITAYENA